MAKQEEQKGHLMPSGETMPGLEHPGIVPGGELSVKSGVDGENVSEEQIQELRQGLGAMEKRRQNLDEQKVIDEQLLEETRSKLLQQLFDLMTQSGVDLNNLESISRFLQDLEEQDSDLREIFEVAFNNLLGNAPMPTGAETPTPPAPPEQGGLMSQYQNLAQGTMMPRQ